jgi:hypothetical protein
MAEHFGMATKSKSKSTGSKKLPKKLNDLKAKKNPRGGPAKGSSAVVSLGKLGRVE